ncbi:hypothetical protein AB4Z45_15990 [Paenibacillus sp. MCAF9]
MYLSSPMCSLISHKSWEKVRDQLVYSEVNGGFPRLMVKDLKYVERTLLHVVQLWGKNAHLETFVEDKKIVFRCDGMKTSRKFV